MCRHIITDSSLRRLAQRLRPQHFEDVLQQVALIVCEMETAQVERIQPYFNFWCVRTITIVSARNGQVGKYCDPVASDEKEVADIQEPEPIDTAPVEGMYWYDRELLKLYAEKGSVRKVAKALNIPVMTMATEIKRVKNNARRILLATID